MIGTFRLRPMMCYQLENYYRYNIESLVTIVATGTVLRPKEQNEITKNLLRGRIPIKQFYATTEQGVVTHWSVRSDINSVKEGFVGRPAAGVKIKVRRRKRLFFANTFYCFCVFIFQTYNIGDWSIIHAQIAISNNNTYTCCIVITNK